MDSSSRPDAIEITDYPALLRRRWRLILIAAAVGLAAAFALVLVSPKTYTSQASVQVTATGAEDTAAATSKNGTTNLDTEAQIVKSTEVATRAQQILKSAANPRALAARVTITVPPNSTILNIAFDGPSPTAARDGAHAFAQAYLDNRAATASDKLGNDVKTATDRITKLAEKLQNVNALIRSTTRGTASHTNALNQQRLITGEIQALNQRLAQANIKASNITPGSIITGASTPDTASNPNPRLYLPAGLMAGLLIGLVLAVVRDRTDKHIRRPQDIERLTGLPVLLTTPGGRRARPLGLQSGRSRVGQSFNQLAHLIAATLGHGHHVILVAGAERGNGPGVVAANLAAAFARTESNVLLVCANLDSTTAADIVGVPQGEGLAEVLLQRTDAEKVVRRAPEIKQLRVLTCGLDIDHASELLQRNTMERLIDRIRQTAKYTIVETSATSVNADAQALADVADGAVIVVEIPLTRYDHVAVGLRQLDRMGTAVLGAVGIGVQKDVAAATAPPNRSAATVAARHRADEADEPLVGPAARNRTGDAEDADEPRTARGRRRGTPVVHEGTSRTASPRFARPGTASEDGVPIADVTVGETSEPPGRFENGDTIRFRASDVLNASRADDEEKDAAPRAEKKDEDEPEAADPVPLPKLREIPRHGSPNGTIPDRMRRR
ncbi:Tyrosine-protein kinase YwqD [Actinomadura rubteroloni]|uniref:Tyrosine-protein kinase YwqD n=1 Tax=Actinomadura rubteroloni TaxID=1926885 RepID=A0A2P4UQ14_9ACTN|nr:Wzz/FepE/Etk N-terminal domain-containing protein [Actinomadura rubteroloni]POM27133.1 Tyrosine-protein kinase YwqD [Actinomadura rubteroloni]